MTCWERRNLQKSSVMSGGAVRLPCCPDPQGLGWRDTGTPEPTRSHSTPSHTHRVTHTQSHVMSFRALNLTDLGAPTCSPVPQGGLGTTLVCGQFVPLTSCRPGHTPVKTP